MARVLLLALYTVLATTIYGQDYCQWYQWSDSDWANSTTQDFEAKIGPLYYLDDSDFTETGDHYGFTWEEIFYTDASNYRPLGFKFAELGANNDPTVCLNVTGAMTYAVELMVYTLTPSSSLCITDMSNDQFMTLQQATEVGTCDTQQIYQCFGAYGTTDILQFASFHSCISLILR